MAGLVLNGIEIPCRLDGSRSANELVGERSRGLSGGYRSSVRSQKGVWKFRTKPVSQEEAEAIRGLVQGLGDYWDFESATMKSVRGRTPSATSDTFGQTGAFKYGAQGGRAAGWAEYLTTVAGVYTLFYWGSVPSGFFHFLIRNDGAKWKTAVRNDAELTYAAITGSTLRLSAVLATPPLWVALTAYSLTNKRRPIAIGNLNYHFEVTTAGTSGASEPAWNQTIGATTTDGSVVWTNLGHWPGYFDDLVVLPFKVPDVWVSQIYAEHNARPWTAPPRLRASGDFFPSSNPTFPTFVVGEIDGSEVVPTMVSGVWTETTEVVSFTLREA